MIRVTHIIGGLEIGGTELFLERLVRSLDRGQFEHRVISMQGLGPVGRRLQCEGVQVDTLRSRSKVDALFTLLKLGRLVRESNPSLVQGWMYHGSLAASVSAWLSRVSCPLVWNIRHSLDRWADEQWLLRREVGFVGRLARIPDRIIFNSQRSAAQHEHLGYPRGKACIIPNGFDLGRFAPDAAMGSEIRAQLGIRSDDLLFGTIGRYHLLKDHDNLLRAASIFAKTNPHAKFLLAGRGVTASNQALMTLIQRLQLNDRVLLLGERYDIADLLKAFDIYVSSSSSEGFPNAVGEAMSSGVPCVVTDAGDSAELVADTGVVVPRRDPVALNGGFAKLTELGYAGRCTLGARARARIRERYSLASNALRYANLYSSLVKV